MRLHFLGRNLPILCLLAIVILAWPFHYPIHFEDALTRTIATDYGVIISDWRMVFEPFLGLLLFLNRALYGLDEIIWTFFWVILGFVFVRGYGILRQGKSYGKSIAGTLVSLPMVIGCCFGLFAIIIFAPLPNNVIQNNSSRILVTTHSHTEFSHDGLIPQQDMFEWHKRNGFDAFFITDHAHCRHTWQFVTEQRSGQFPMEPLVMPGEEYSASNHMSLLGLKGCPFDTKGMDDKTVIDTVHAIGGAVLINHWFDGKGEDKTVYRDLGADGFEIENVGSDLYYDRSLFQELKQFCADNGLMMVGGLDFHGYGRVCSVYNAFLIPGWRSMDPEHKQRSILEVLRYGPQENLQILLYKDRPFYPKTHLFWRPFTTAIGYFRTLNVLQVFSWVFWTFLVWAIAKKTRIPSWVQLYGLIFLALTLGLYMGILGYRFYIKANEMAGYPGNQNDIYKEYWCYFWPLGTLLAVYAGGMLIWRWKRPGRADDGE